MSGSRGKNGSFTRAKHARVLKLVDRLDSGSSVRKDVGVRVPLRAPRKNPDCEVRVFHFKSVRSLFLVSRFYGGNTKTDPTTVAAKLQESLRGPCPRCSVLPPLRCMDPYTRAQNRLILQWLSSSRLQTLSGSRTAQQDDHF